MKQRWGLDRNVLRPTPGDPRGAEQNHWNTGAKENQQLKPTVGQAIDKKSPARLGTISIKILVGLNRFYGIPTSPSASIMAQNIQLFGPLEGFLINTMMKRRWGLDRDVLRPTPGDPWGENLFINDLYFMPLKGTLDYFWLIHVPASFIRIAVLFD